MIKKEMIAMLLAGGQGSRLGVLTANVAKPAVAFGGKYRIIDFPLSNCINSGVDTVGVLTQYQPLKLNTHIGIGIPWDLDRNVGGISILPPYEKSTSSEWYTGTANAIFQNLKYMEQYNPDYVLILGGDHIYKMDYQVMLDFHKSNNADVTLATIPVPMEEASRFGVCVTDDNKQIVEFQENTYKQFASAIEKLKKQGMKSVIFDVRNNPGGRYDIVCQILDDLLPEGTLVSTKDKYGKEEKQTSDAKALNMPMVVIQNENSASASEIFAGAIQDFKAGTIIGTRSFGKGIVQQMWPLNDGSAIKLTVEKYYTPSGKNIHGKGITPDVEVKASTKGNKDVQLNKAVEILENK